jgi:2'-5' RNA ligase
MRLFFALEPSGQDKLAIESWRYKALSSFEKPVPSKNFHITLAFLGQTTSSQLDELIQKVDSLCVPPKFSVKLNHLGYWSKPKVLWLGCDQTSDSLRALEKELNKVSISSGIIMQKREFIPHLTLIRKCQENPSAPIIEPSFFMEFCEFHLFESVSSSKGVIYQRLASWQLSPTQIPKSPENTCFW